MYMVDDAWILMKIPSGWWLGRGVMNNPSYSPKCSQKSQKSITFVKYSHLSICVKMFQNFLEVLFVNDYFIILVEY